jgi:hypothetical protein
MTDFFAPSYWYGAGPDFSGLANAYASTGQTNAYNASIANTLAQANSFNPWANSGGSFGAMTNYYSGLGANYGRNTLSSIMAHKKHPSGSVTRGPDLAPPPYVNPITGSGGSGPKPFKDLWHDRFGPLAPAPVPSPYGPGGYPPMEPAVPGQQGNLQWNGMPNVSS